MTLALTLFLTLAACVIPGMKARRARPHPALWHRDRTGGRLRDLGGIPSAGNANFANDLYKRQWAWIKIDGVRAGGTGIDAITLTKVLLRTPGTISQMEFNFGFPKTPRISNGETHPQSYAT